MSDDIDSIIEGELYQDERLLWKGRPGRLFIVKGADYISLLGVLFLLSVSVSAMVGIGAPPSAMIPMTIFFSFGIGRIPYQAWLRSRTGYAVTSERVLIVTEGFSRNIKSMPLLTLSNVELSERRDGRGTIVFDGVGTGRLTATARYRGEPVPRPSFEMISDARDVHEIIMAARREAS